MMQLTKPLKMIMFVGTASDVGKSVLSTAFCRNFLQDGFTPAPFKVQNMSLNSYATPEGLEIGSAQAVQAEAAGINSHTDMNPVLLKPTSDTDSQVILNGRVHGNISAAAYFLTDQCWGSYIHGILEIESIIDSIIDSISNGLTNQEKNCLNEETKKLIIPKQTYRQFKNEQYDKLAVHIRQHIDLQQIYLDLIN